jgi:hypothetical protein
MQSDRVVARSKRKTPPQPFVGFSDHHGIGLIIGLSVAVFIFILLIIIFWVPRRRRVPSYWNPNSKAEIVSDAGAHDGSCRNVGMPSLPIQKRFTAA